MQTAEVISGGSYLSQSDLRLHFGIGSEAVLVDKVEIAWPSGTTQVLSALPTDQIIVIRER